MRTGMPHRKSIPTAWPLFRLFEVDAWLRSARGVLGSRGRLDHVQNQQQHEGERC